MGKNENEIRKEVLKEIVTGYDQLIGLFKTGDAAALAGHAYDAKESEREITLLQQLQATLIEMIARIP